MTRSPLPSLEIILDFEANANILIPYSTTATTTSRAELHGNPFYTVFTLFTTQHFIFTQNRDKLF